ncbi:acyl carrier protein [Flavobacterium maritimum]|uniref:acyl carrier protein n=1 Tax=Flavobacterium maritimum TaxID=3149042 RepID=UPI0032B4FA8B
MTKQEFILGLQEELELGTVLSGNTNIKDLDEWDSIAVIVLIGYVSNEFDVILNLEDIEEMSSIDSLIQKIGLDKFSK